MSGEISKTRNQAQAFHDTERQAADVDRVATRADTLVALHDSHLVASRA
jgi:hypothetical protein